MRSRLYLSTLESRTNPAAAGELDTTFGDGGRVTVGFDLGDSTGLNDIGEVVAVLPDGKIVVAGRAFFSADRYDFGAARFLPDGSLDTTFGEGGIQTVHVGEGGDVSDLAFGLAIQDDGKIVMVGNADVGGGDFDFAVVRLNPDGSPDATFDADGMRTIAFNIGDTMADKARSVAIQSDDKIVIAGWADTQNFGHNFAIARLNADGSIDTTFDGNGRKTVGFQLGGSNNDRGHAVALQPDGAIVVTGLSHVGGENFDFSVTRLLPDGAFDTTFDGDGKVVIAFDIGGNFDDRSRTVIIQPDAKILIGGYAGVGSTDGADLDFALARLNPDGSPDTTFGENGRKTVAFDLGGDLQDRTRGLFLTPTGDILVSGWATFDGDDEDFAVARLHGDGTLDASFGGDGTVTIPFDLGGDLQDRGRSVVMQADGGIIVAGAARNAAGNSDFALIRLYSAADTPDAVPPVIVLPIPPSTDLTVFKTDGVNTIETNRSVTYTITVSNAGPDPAATATVVDAFPNVTGVAWTATFAGGATGDASGSGPINETIFLPVGGSVTYTATATIAAGFEGTLTNTATATPGGDAIDPTPGDATATDTTQVVAPPQPPPVVAPPAFAVGPGPGRDGFVVVYRADGTEAFRVDAFPGFSGGVRVATADINGDGIVDLIAGTGPGTATLVRIFDGKSGAKLFEVQPFEASFTGGVYVAAGDTDGDGFADFAISPDQGGGPRVRLFDGETLAQVNDFFGIDDKAFRGGARSAIADLNGDGTGDLIVAAGFGGGPRLAGFDGLSLASSPVKLFDDFFAFERTLRNGVFIAGGDLDGDGKAEVVAGGGPGGGPRVFAMSGAGVVASRGATLTPVANFFAGDAENRGGVRLAVKDLDGDTKLDVLTGAGPNAAGRVSTYFGKDLTPGAATPGTPTLEPFAGFLGGVFVG